MFGKWFEVKVSLKRPMKDGLQKQVKEVYIVDALNFTEAESRILEELQVYGDIDIVGIKNSDAREIIDSHNPEDGYWYKAKISLITTDENNDKEKKANVIYYVRAKDFKGGLDNTIAFMSDSIMDYTILSITETAVMEVLEYKKLEEK